MNPHFTSLLLRHGHADRDITARHRSRNFLDPRRVNDGRYCSCGAQKEECAESEAYLYSLRSLPRDEKQGKLARTFPSLH